jgi:hypothetical protein
VGIVSIPPSPAETRSIQSQASPETTTKESQTKRVHFRSEKSQTDVIGAQLRHASTLPMVNKTPEKTNDIPWSSTPLPKVKRKRLVVEDDVLNGEFDESISYVDSEKKDPTWNHNTSFEGL